MGKIRAEVSAGELLDKVSILEIKYERIQDINERRTIKSDLESLRQIRDEELREWHLIDDAYLYLKATNEALWEIEEKMRILESKKDFGEEFIQLARLVYFEKDKRSKILREINEKLDSDLDSLHESSLPVQ